jgi:peptide-methionine (S)-S-oxide reductase
MTTTLSKIGLGGGCHWCTEGVYNSLIGISKVNQGWIAASGDNAAFSEAIEVYFDSEIISLSTLITIHLYTHASTSNHAMRDKYRSAIYSYNDQQHTLAKELLTTIKANFDQEVITQVYAFRAFKANKAELTNYLYTGPNRPFCQSYIHPKLNRLLSDFNQHVDHKKLADSGVKLTNI